VPTLFAFYLFPRLIIGILMGAKFLSQASLLVPISMVVFFASINNLLFSYFIAIRKYVSAIPALIGISSTLLLLIVNHSIITDVIGAYVTGNLITLTLLIVITLTTGKIFKVEKN
jgi:O-antigen/teichoic acid export membrane protein